MEFKKRGGEEREEKEEEKEEKEEKRRRRRRRRKKGESKSKGDEGKKQEPVEWSVWVFRPKKTAEKKKKGRQLGRARLELATSGLLLGISRITLRRFGL